MRDLNVTSLPNYRNANSLIVLAIAAAFINGGASPDRGAFAQHTQAPPNSGPGMRPGMGPGMGPGANPVRIPGQADPNGPKGPVQELKIDPVNFPPGFTLPPAKSPLMDEGQPFVSADELKKISKDLSKYSNVLRNATSTDADKALLRMGLKYRIAMMCLRENRPQLSTLHDLVTKDLVNAASTPSLTGPQVKSFRQLLMQELVALIDPLLTTQDYYVRLHLVLILGELNLTEENSKLSLKLEAYAPSLESLVKVITNPEQPDAVKVCAVNGIVRLMKLGNPIFPLRMTVGQALAGELQRAGTHPWYQMRLAGAMSVVDVNVDQAGKPFVVNALVGVLKDVGRPYLVRAEAAKSLGRIPLPPVVKTGDITQAVGGFALQLAKAAQQAPPQQKDDPRWKGEFIRVYLAFQQLDANDFMADKKSKAGLLNSAQGAAKPIYDLVLPMVVSTLHGQRLTVQQIQALEASVGPQPAGGAAPAEKNATEKTATEKTSAENKTDPMTTVGKRP